MNIAIDATNIGGGGGITHLKELLKEFVLSENFLEMEIKLLVFGSEKTLSQMPSSPLIEKVSHSNLNKGRIHRVFYQLFIFDQELKAKSTDILFSITGDYIGKFKPVVGMSRNMLLYERNVWREIKDLKEIIRFWLNFRKQKRSFENSEGIIFISNYASDYISNILKLKGKKIKVINHGVSHRFKGVVKHQESISKYSIERPFKILYVSTIHVYKHQWNVVRAIAKLRDKGFPIVLDLVGGVIFPAAGIRLDTVIKELDPKKEFINYFGDQPYENINKFYADADTIVFASTCENMPNILIESMASGVPIACSNKQPMPEFLKENGVYFDSYEVDSIVSALEILIGDHNLRKKIAENNLIEVEKFSWKKTFELTFKFLIENGKKYNNR